MSTIYKVYALQIFPLACCKYSMDTWADTHIWNWTGLGEGRMPARALLASSPKGLSSSSPQPLLLLYEWKGGIILCTSLELSENLSTQIRPQTSCCLEFISAVDLHPQNFAESLSFHLNEGFPPLPRCQTDPSHL